MADGSVPKTIAIGLDAADQVFIRENASALPAIAKFMASHPPVALAAEPLSGAIWSSFVTCSGPGEHGVFRHLQWDPTAVGMRRTHPDWVGPLTPFWRPLARAGRRVIAFDIPFVFEGTGDGALEIMNWASHDQVGPFSATDTEEKRHILSTYGVSPIGIEVPVPKWSGKLKSIRDQLVKSAELKGRLAVDLMRRREWDLFLLAFGETHRSGHLLYPTDDPRSAIPDGALLQVYQAVDQAVGRILDEVQPAWNVFLFALHGMQHNASQAHLARPMLDSACRLVDGDVVPSTPQRGAIRWLRRKVPARLQHAVAEAVPVPVRDFVVARDVGGGIVPGVTKAVTIDSDQPGQWRFIVAGREARGAISAEEVAPLSERLADLFRGFTTLDGRPLIANVMFPSTALAGPRAFLLPDIVAEWDEELEQVTAAVHPALGLIEQGVVSGRTGNHRFNGFYCYRGSGTIEQARPMHVSAFGKLLASLAA